METTPHSPLTIPVAVTCPGLTCTQAGIYWRDSLNREHDLSREPKCTPGEIALMMRRSTEWVLRKIRAGELYPYVRHNERYIEVYVCGVPDYYTRHTAGVPAS